MRFWTLILLNHRACCDVQASDPCVSHALTPLSMRGPSTWQCTNRDSPTSPTRCGARSRAQSMEMKGSSNTGTHFLCGAVTLRRYAKALMDQR